MKICNLQWSRDGKVIATASGIWSQEGKLLHTGFSKTNIRAFVWSKDCKTIISASYDSGQIVLWDDSTRYIKDIN